MWKDEYEVREERNMELPVTFWQCVTEIVLISFYRYRN